MIDELTDEQLESFLRTLTKKYHRDEFYELYLDYLKKIGIEVEEEEEAILEQAAFNVAKERGFIGYDIIEEIYDRNAFQEKMNTLVERNRYMLYHFIYELDNDISTTAYWDKWNQLPPLGWIGSWCTCGHFYPVSFDIGEMDVEAGEYTKITEEYQPRIIGIESVEAILICSDSFFRLRLDNGNIIAVRPYKFESGFAYHFIKNPLDILK